MFRLFTDSPAKKTNILKINLSGRFTLNIIDELIIVHHRNSYSSMIFDIKIAGEFDGYVMSNYPIIKKASIQPTEVIGAHPTVNTEALSTIEINSPISTSGASSPSSSHTSSSMGEVYSMNWIMFLPNVIIDAKIGCFWFIELNLINGDLKPFQEIEDDPLKLAEFLLYRKNTKLHVLNVCAGLIRKRSSLKIIENVFNKINEFYRHSLTHNSNTSTGSSNIGNHFRCIPY